MGRDFLLGPLVIARCNDFGLKEYRLKSDMRKKFFIQMVAGLEGSRAGAGCPESLWIPH